MLKLSKAKVEHEGLGRPDLACGPPFEVSDLWSISLTQYHAS